jgi:hypothetical protein
MRLKTLERLMAVLLLVAWVLLLVRAHDLRPIAFYQMQPVLYVGDLAVIILVVLSLTTKRTLLSEKREEEKEVPEPTIEE